MTTLTYEKRRGQLEEYFDRTAAEAWAKLTSDVKVSGIRATVRAGRERMRTTLLSWLPPDLRGKRVLDAGCGTGMLAVEAARRGAHVTAIDLSPTLIDLARERLPADIGDGHIDFLVGDMLNPGPTGFDHVVAMDSLIHYVGPDMVRMIARLADLTAGAPAPSVAVTFAPRTPALSLMHAVGTLFPRSDRAPAIEPIAPARLGRLIAQDAALQGWATGRTERIKSGFYTSQALEVRPR